uniref:NADH-ubiquinone oxidoreductase chain 2 n=1 Tax=Tapinoma melanocephalum TaxID=219810 RepID=A0A6B9VI81_9HYME|nr:NADH dehydrogenase subunit 2 [Tapinoma melanocephalum]
MYFNLFIKYFITLLLLIITMLSMFINDLLNIWLIMEINNFLFISYISFSMKNKKMIFFYYIIQIIPSMILIFSISLNNMNLFNKHFLNLLILLSLMIKLGIPPFHFWMVSLSSYMNWNLLFFMLTIQKIIPFYILSMINIPNYFLLMSLYMCSLIPPIMMINLTNLKKLLTYSSINQLGWMIMLIYLKNIIWLYYLIMYIMISLLIFFTLSYNKIYNNFLENNTLNNMIILMMMLNMASMPPFSFFIFKWFSVFILIFNSNLFFMLMIMMISSFLMFLMYINMIYLSMFINMSKSKMIYLTNVQSNFTYLKSLYLFMIMSISLFILII